jgi:hypothetical protein
LDPNRRLRAAIVGGETDVGAVRLHFARRDQGLGVHVDADLEVGQGGAGDVVQVDGAYIGPILHAIILALEPRRQNAKKKGAQYQFPNTNHTNKLNIRINGFHLSHRTSPQANGIIKTSRLKCVSAACH